MGAEVTTSPSPRIFRASICLAFGDEDGYVLAARRLARSRSRSRVDCGSRFTPSAMCRKASAFSGFDSTQHRSSSLIWRARRSRSGECDGGWSVPFAMRTGGSCSSGAWKVGDVARAYNSATGASTSDPPLGQKHAVSGIATEPAPLNGSPHRGGHAECIRPPSTSCSPVLPSTDSMAGVGRHSPREGNGGVHKEDSSPKRKSPTSNYCQMISTQSVNSGTVTGSVVTAGAAWRILRETLILVVLLTVLGFARVSKS